MLCGLIVVVAITGIGCLVLRAARIRPSDSRLAYLGWSYVAGAAAFGTAGTAWLAAGLPLLPSAAWVIAAIGLLALLQDGILHSRSGSTSRRPPVAMIVVVACAAALLADVVLRSSAWPICEGDEAAIYAAQAKVFHQHGGSIGEMRALALDHSAGIARLFHHPDYPKLVPLLGWMVHALSGGIDPFGPRIPVAAFGLASLFVLASALFRRAGLLPATIAFVFVAFGSFGVERSRFADGDAIVALGFLVMVDAWLRHRAEGESRWLALAACGAALSALAKQEGTMLFVAFLLGCGLANLMRPRLRLSPHHAWFALPVVAIAALWAFNARIGVGNVFFQERDPEFLLYREVVRPPWIDRCGSVAKLILSDVILGRMFGGVFLIALAAAALNRRRLADPALRATLIAGLIAFSGYAMAFVATKAPLQWHWLTAGTRVFGQIVPAVTLWIIAAIDLEPEGQSHEDGVDPERLA